MSPSESWTVMRSAKPYRPYSSTGRGMTTPSCSHALSRFYPGGSTHPVLGSDPRPRSQQVLLRLLALPSGGQPNPGAYELSSQAGDQIRVADSAFPEEGHRLQPRASSLAPQRPPGVGIASRGPTEPYCVIPFLLPPPKNPCPARAQKASQAGRRRFDPGRPLS